MLDAADDASVVVVVAEVPSHPDGDRSVSAPADGVTTPDEPVRCFALIAVCLAAVVAPSLLLGRRGALAMPA